MQVYQSVAINKVSIINSFSFCFIDTSVEKQIDEDEESSNDENLVGKVRRKKLKPSSENK
jgi:hypothetical protein